MYARSLQNFVIGRLPRTEEANARYKNPDNDPRGVWKPSDISVKTYTPSCDYPITTPSGRVVEPPTGRCWAFTKEAFQEKVKDHRIWFGPNGDNVPSMKRFLSELRSTGMAPSSLLFYKEVGHSQEGAQELSKLLGGGYFNGPKPVRLLRRLLTLANTRQDSVIMDFFSGSATTAHAVMELNAEDGGQRKFIMVQIPEECAQDSEAYQAGFSNICEIGEERIRRAGRKIIEEHPDEAEKLDIGFRVFKIDSPNVKETRILPQDTTQEMLLNLEDNIKEDRTPEDLLIQSMLALGISLDAEISRESSANTEDKLVFTVRKRDSEDFEPGLIACFDSDVSEDVASYIAHKHPAYAVFCDRSFMDDAARVNFDRIFGDYAPQTKLMVL